MQKEIAVRKNLDLLNEFMKYAFANPGALDKIPPGAELIILPMDDQELYEYNRNTADKVLSQGGSVIFVKMRKPRISTPKFELAPSSPT